MLLCLCSVSVASRRYVHGGDWWIPCSTTLLAVIHFVGPLTYAFHIIDQLGSVRLELEGLLSPDGRCGGVGPNAVRLRLYRRNSNVFDGSSVIQG